MRFMRSHPSDPSRTKGLLRARRTFGSLQADQRASRERFCISTRRTWRTRATRHGAWQDFLDRVCHRAGGSVRAGGICRLANRAHDSAADPGDDARRPRESARAISIRSSLPLARRVGPVGRSVQHDDAAPARFPPVAVGPLAPGAANNAGDRRFVSRSRDRDRLRRLCGNGQSRRAAAARRASQAARPADDGHLASARAAAAAARRRAAGAAAIIRPTDSTA